MMFDDVLFYTQLAYSVLRYFSHGYCQALYTIKNYIDHQYHSPIMFDRITRRKQSQVQSKSYRFEPPRDMTQHNWSEPQPFELIPCRGGNYSKEINKINGHPGPFCLQYCNNHVPTLALNLLLLALGIRGIKM